MQSFPACGPTAVAIRYLRDLVYSRGGASFALTDSPRCARRPQGPARRDRPRAEALRPDNHRPARGGRYRHGRGGGAALILDEDPRDMRRACRLCRSGIAAPG